VTWLADISAELEWRNTDTTAALRADTETADGFRQHRNLEAAVRVS